MIVLTLVWPIVQPLNLQAADYYWDTDTTDVGNLTDGTGLGGNGTWDLVTSNWWPIPAAALTTYVNGSNVTFTAPASTIPSVNIVTLGVASGVDANKLTFQRSGYVLSGGDLTLSGGAGIAVNFAETATINSQLLGSAGLTKTGGGALRLAAGNLYTGTTTINSGSIVINNGSALGTDASTIVVNGNATRGFGGGSLVLEGTRGGVGANVTRAISILGLGPNSDRGAALQSVRDNTITGLVSSSTGAVVGTTRITSTGASVTSISGRCGLNTSTRFTLGCWKAASARKGLASKHDELGPCAVMMHNADQRSLGGAAGVAGAFFIGHGR